MGENSSTFYLASFNTGLGQLSLVETEDNPTSDVLQKFQPTICKKRLPPSQTVHAQKIPKTHPLKQSTPAIQITNNVQQDPNDFVATSQSLDTGKKSFSCKLCAFNSLAKSKVIRHINLMHITQEDQFKCTLCDKTAKLKENMKKHYMGKHKLPEPLARAAVDT